jgi:thiamine-phosphate pyrophosphorylase
MTKIYLISPPRLIFPDFFNNLKIALNSGLVPVFQLRIKDYDSSEVVKITKQTQKICRDYNCQLILNDYPQIALDLETDGVHVGKSDTSIATIRKQVPDYFAIGASCYNSKHLAMQAGEEGANYLSFGAFFPTTTKKVEATASLDILSWAVELLNLPIVAIGGINNHNCHSLVANKADFLAVISFVWQHPQGILTALEQLNMAIQQAQNKHRHG